MRVLVLGLLLLPACGRINFDEPTNTSDANSDGLCANPSYPQVVLSDGPLGYWRLQDSGTTTAADSSGNGLVGTYSGGYTQHLAGPLVGTVDYAVNFDGVTSQVHIPWMMLTGNAARTMEAWLSTNTGGGNPVSYGTHGTSELSQISFWSGGLGFTECCSSTIGWTVPFTTVNTEDGNWHHVAVTYDGVTVLVYLDGVQYAPTGDPANLPLVTGASDVVFGSETDGSDTYTGKLSEVAIYSTALSAAKILAHYQARSGSGC